MSSLAIVRGFVQKAYASKCGAKRKKPKNTKLSGWG
jgi:hypothetical protein